MKDLPERYDRNIRFFGEEGQRKPGVGGLGSPLVQHLALLGVGGIDLVDDEDLAETNRNRFVGARHDDPVPGSPKVRLSKRLANEIDPTIKITEVPNGLVSEKAFAAVKAADVVFGCFDEDGPRAILNELCAAYRKNYIDLASDIPEPGVYGGRICTAWDGDGCLLCMSELDRRAVQEYLQSDAERQIRNRIYGIDQNVLAGKGPSVSPINGVVASLAAVEFMVAVTGLRKPKKLLNYSGHLGTMNVRREQAPDCSARTFAVRVRLQTSSAICESRICGGGVMPRF